MIDIQKAAAYTAKAATCAVPPPARRSLLLIWLTLPKFPHSIARKTAANTAKASFSYMCSATASGALSTADLTGLSRIFSHFDAQKTAADTAKVTFSYMCRNTAGGAVPAAARLLTCVLPHHLARCTAPTVLAVSCKTANARIFEEKCCCCRAADVRAAASPGCKVHGAHRSGSELQNTNF